MGSVCSPVVKPHKSASSLSHRTQHCKHSSSSGPSSWRPTDSAQAQLPLQKWDLGSLSSKRFLSMIILPSCSADRLLILSSLVAIVSLPPTSPRLPRHTPRPRRCFVTQFQISLSDHGSSPNTSYLSHSSLYLAICSGVAVSIPSAWASCTSMSIRAAICLVSYVDDP